MVDMSQNEQPQPEKQVEHRNRPNSPAFRRFIASHWEPRDARRPALLTAAEWARPRREALTSTFPGERLVLPAGELRVRSNDTDYRFRAHSGFSHLTGLGAAAEPDSVLLLEPDGTALLFFRPRAERDSQEFYGDPRVGELWVGPRPTLAEVEALTGLACRHLDELADALVKDAVRLRLVRDADAALDQLVDQARDSETATDGEEQRSADDELLRALSDLRFVKDAWEVEQLREAVAATVAGFEDIVRALPRAIGQARGERIIETAFEAQARIRGNGVGYDTIAASGHHACTLHWIKNDGPVRAGDLLLVDAGVEAESLYTADVTRTLPVDGHFTDAQRRVYEVVLEAADAAFAVARPGTRFREVHEAAMRVIAARLLEWGWLPEGTTLEQTLDPDGQFHRRWMVHGTSHHLGIDVHDCAQAKRELYLDAELRPGMVFTIEPGLYLMPDDTLVPPELRGIGIRIEDDVVVTEDGVDNLSAALPRRPDEIEAWMAGLMRTS
jgi:Xaa-Pro aminopeptidase